MRSSGSAIENEIKLRVPSAREARALLRGAGFQVVHRRSLEVNLVFDWPEQGLRRSGRLLRLRRHSGRDVLTFKGPSVPGRHKARPEWEVDVSDGKTFAEVLGHLGLAESFRYEKYRSEWEKPGQRGTVMLDETPIGVFLELEGTGRWIDRTAKALGFGVDHYITASYGSLYMQYAAENGTNPRAMEFR